MKSCIILAVALLGFQGITSVSGQSCGFLTQESACIDSEAHECGWNGDGCSECTSYHADEATCTEFEGCGWDGDVDATHPCKACDTFSTNEPECERHTGCGYIHTAEGTDRCTHCSDMGNTECDNHGGTCMWEPAADACRPLQACNEYNNQETLCKSANEGCGYDSTADTCDTCVKPLYEDAFTESQCSARTGCGWNDGYEDSLKCVGCNTVDSQMQCNNRQWCQWVNNACTYMHAPTVAPTFGPTPSTASPVASTASPVQSTASPVASTASPVASTAAPVTSSTITTTTSSTTTTKTDTTTTKTDTTVTDTTTTTTTVADCSFHSTEELCSSFKTCGWTTGETTDYCRTCSDIDVDYCEAHDVCKLNRGGTACEGAVCNELRHKNDCDKYANCVYHIVDDYGTCYHVNEAPTAAPTPSTASPVQSTASPVQSTASPVQSTASPVQSTASPVQSTASPVASTASPVQSTAAPTNEPTTHLPTDMPTNIPTYMPTDEPTDITTDIPTDIPTVSPSHIPTGVPTTNTPSHIPTGVPTTDSPSNIPTSEPTTQSPTGYPTRMPSSASPSHIPTGVPTTNTPTTAEPETTAATPYDGSNTNGLITCLCNHEGNTGGGYYGENCDTSLTYNAENINCEDVTGTVTVTTTITITQLISTSSFNTASHNGDNTTVYRANATQVHSRLGEHANYTSPECLPHLQGANTNASGYYHTFWGDSGCAIDFAKALQADVDSILINESLATFDEINEENIYDQHADALALQGKTQVHVIDSTGTDHTVLWITAGVVIGIAVLVVIGVFGIFMKGVGRNSAGASFEQVGLMSSFGKFVEDIL